MSTRAGLGTIFRTSDFVRFVQGGVVKTFRWASQAETLATTTKKMLTAIKLGHATTRAGSFVIPSQDTDGRDVFAAIDGSGIAEFAAVSYTGRDLDANAVFARYVDSGAQIADVAALLAELDDYLTQIKTFKVGNVLGLRSEGAVRELFLAHQRPPDGSM